MDSARISEIICNDDSVRPLIVNFQNGTLVPGNEDKLICIAVKDKKDNHIAAVASDKMVYAGQISRDDNLYNNFLLVRNRKTGNCKLIAVDNVLLNPEPPGKRKTPNLPNDITDKSRHLRKQFGSKREIRRTEQYEKMKVDVKNIKDDLEKTAIATTVKLADIEEHYTSESNPYKPPINREATNVAEVYTLETVAPVDLLQTLAPKVKTILQEDAQNIKTSSFVKKQIIRLQNSSSEEKLLKCQILLYIDCLISVYLSPARAIGTKKYMPCPYSKELSAFILKNFTVTTQTGRSRPMSMRDKCVCYIIVLCIYVCDYNLNIEDLITDLKLSAKKFLEFSRVLSFQTSKDKHITLKLPLPPVVQGRGRDRKRK